MPDPDLQTAHPDAFKAGQRARLNGQRRVPGPAYSDATFRAWIAGYDADPMTADGLDDADD